MKWFYVDGYLAKIEIIQSGMNLAKINVGAGNAYLIAESPLLFKTVP